jgi:hypothetical protein
MTRRTYWRAKDFVIKDEPLVKSLIEYRLRDDRVPVPNPQFTDLIEFTEEPNLISSITDDGKQMPILDLDFPHQAVPSSTPGHTHLYLNTVMSKWQWFWLMWGLWQAGVIELGFFVWSVRRGGNFVRLPGLEKSEDPAEAEKSTYGWFFKLKDSG